MMDLMPSSDERWYARLEPLENATCFAGTRAEKKILAIDFTRGIPRGWKGTPCTRVLYVVIQTRVRTME